MKERSEIDRAYDPCECKHLRFEHIANATGICARCHVEKPADKACVAFKRKVTFKSLIEIMPDARPVSVAISPMTLADLILIVAEGGSPMPPVANKQIKIFGVDFSIDNAMADREFQFSDGSRAILD